MTDGSVLVFLALEVEQRVRGLRRRPARLGRRDISNSPSQLIRHLGESLHKTDVTQFLQRGANWAAITKLSCPPALNRWLGMQVRLPLRSPTLPCLLPTLPLVYLARTSRPESNSSLSPANAAIGLSGTDIAPKLHCFSRASDLPLLSSRGVGCGQGRR